MGQETDRRYRPTRTHCTVKGGIPPSATITRKYNPLGTVDGDKSPMHPMQPTNITALSVKASLN